MKVQDVMNVDTKKCCEDDLIGSFINFGKKVAGKSSSAICGTFTDIYLECTRLRNS